MYGTLDPSHSVHDRAAPRRCCIHDMQFAVVTFLPSGYEVAMASRLQPSQGRGDMDPSTLSLVLEPLAEDIHEPEFAAYTPLVGFEAFLSAQRVFGWVRLDADRLTDLLNAHDLMHLENVHVEDLRDGSTVSTDETLLPRSELIAVIASGPRGDPGRRRATRPHAVVIESGIYRIGGCVHAPSGVDPEIRLHDGGPMVPLTGAWLEYHSGGQRRRDVVGTVIVNRRLATRIEVITLPAGMPMGPPNQT